MVIKGLGERFIQNVVVKDKNQIDIGSMNYDQIYPTKKRFAGLRAESIPSPTITGRQTINTVATVTSSVTATNYYDGSGNAMFIFKNIACPNGTTPVAETLTDTLNLASSTNAITITGNNATDTVDFKLKSQGTYTPSNVTTDRTYDADSQTTAYTGIDNLQAGTPYAQLTDLNALRLAYNELADVVGTLIADLKLSGIIS